jgi:putative transposase
MTKYSSTNHSKHCLKCHLILVCKYRKLLLKESLKEDMKQILLTIAKNSNFNIETIETDSNHVHLLVYYIPRLSISSIIRKLKQESTIAIWKAHKAILSVNFHKEHIFWSSGYFACSVGEASEEAIRNYILSQG